MTVKTLLTKIEEQISNGVNLIIYEKNTVKGPEIILTRTDSGEDVYHIIYGEFNPPLDVIADMQQNLKIVADAKFGTTHGGRVTQEISRFDYKLDILGIRRLIRYLTSK